MELKKVIKGLFVVNRLISWAEIIVGYIILLIKGKKLQDFYNTEEFGAIDRNTRKVNKTLILLTIFLIMIGIASAILVNITLRENVQMVGIQINGVSIGLILILIASTIAIIFYLNGLLLLPVCFYYSTSLIITQINELNSGMIKVLTYQSIHK